MNPEYEVDDFDLDDNINGTERNDKWDGKETVDGSMCDVDDCEDFLDYGLDRLPDLYENYNYEVEDDNFIITSPGQLPINSIYLMKNSIWYNVDFSISEFSLFLSCAEVESATDGVITTFDGSGTTISKSNTSISDGSGILTELSFCQLPCLTPFFPKCFFR